MKSKVTENGVLIPKHLLEGVDEVDIRKEQNVILVVPIVTEDPILELGEHPVDDSIADASIHHDEYIYK